MGEVAYVHIVDDDPFRRAKMARQLYDLNLHAEIYEDLGELAARRPTRGAVLISDDTLDVDLDAEIRKFQLGGNYLPFAMFSSDPSRRKVVRAMCCGALDYLEWPCTRDDLVDTMSRITDVGERKVKVERLRAQARQLVARLTPREREVLGGIVQGGSNKVIAEELGISPRTVEIHRASMMSRLNAQSAADAVRIGLHAGLED